MRGSGRRTTQRVIVPDDHRGAEIARTTVPSTSSSRTTLGSSPAPSALARGRRGLACAGLDQQHPTGREPLRRRRPPPAGAGRGRRAPVQRQSGLVEPGLRGHPADLGGGHVGRVDGEYVDPPAQRPSGSASKRSPVVDPGQVAPGAGHRRPGPGRRRAPPASVSASATTRPTAPDPQHRSTTTAPGTAQAASTASRASSSVRRRGTNTPGVHRDPEPGEVGPAEQVLQRLPLAAPGHPGVQLARRRSPHEEQSGLLLGEHAAGGTQRVDDWSSRAAWLSRRRHRAARSARASRAR